MYITMTYNRDEYAVRNTYVFSASAISGAFGGLLAYGLTQINAAGMHGWQWMYLVEVSDMNLLKTYKITKYRASLACF
jgi:hypothetical protein